MPTLVRPSCLAIHGWDGYPQVKQMYEPRSPKRLGGPVNSWLMFHPNAGVSVAANVSAPVKRIVAIGRTANTLSCESSACTSVWLFASWSSRCDTSFS